MQRWDEACGKVLVFFAWAESTPEKGRISVACTEAGTHSWPAVPVPEGVPVAMQHSGSSKPVGLRMASSILGKPCKRVTTHLKTHQMCTNTYMSDERPFINHGRIKFPEQCCGACYWPGMLLGQYTQLICDMS